MSPLKRLEVAGKSLAALLLALLLGRPWRRHVVPPVPRRVLLVRTDARVGEALLTTPLISALRALNPPPEVEVLVHAKVARVLEELPGLARLRVLGQNTSLGSLRQEGYDLVVDCGNWTAPSVHNAIYARIIAGRSPVLGPAAFPVGTLHSHPVPPREGTQSEVAQRLHLLSPLLGEDVAADPPGMSFRAPRPAAEGSALETLLKGIGAGTHAVVNPGGRLGWRRIDPGTFAAAARALAAEGRVPIVTWGPGEEGMAQEVVSAVPGAILAPPTDLDGLALLMSAAGLTVCNNTGPMHLSVALGVPTLAFFLHMDMARWGHAHPPHRMVDLTGPAKRREPLGPLAAEAAVNFARGR